MEEKGTKRVKCPFLPTGPILPTTRTYTGPLPDPSVCGALAWGRGVCSEGVTPSLYVGEADTDKEACLGECITCSLIVTEQGADGGKDSLMEMVRSEQGLE